MVGRDRVFYAIIAIRKHKQSDDVGYAMPSLTLDSTHTVGRLWRGMQSLHLDRIYGWRMLGEACNYGRWQELMVERRRAWQTIIALEQH